MIGSCRDRREYNIICGANDACVLLCETENIQTNQKTPENENSRKQQTREVLLYVLHSATECENKILDPPPPETRGRVGKKKPKRQRAPTGNTRKISLSLIVYYYYVFIFFFT